MSVTYYYDTANGLTAASTSTTSGMTIVSDQVMLVTSGSTVSAPTLLVSAVDLTGSGTPAAHPSDATLVYNGGIVTATVSGVAESLSGGGAIVTAGGEIVSAIVDPGAGLIIDGGVTSGSVLSGGFESVFSGGTASATTVSAGSQSVFNGGTATATTVSGGGFQEIYSGGTANSGSINGLATQDVYSGGTANNSLVYAGGTQNVHAGGTATLDILTGTANIFGSDIHATVSSGGVENVLSGGKAAASVLVNGGSQVVAAGGVATGASVEMLGTQTVAAGGVTGGTQIFGGTVYVLSGGLSTNLAMSATGGEVVVSGGGEAAGNVIQAGLIEVMSGGLVTNTTLAGGQVLVMGGTTYATTIYANGSELVMAGGTANNTIVAAGGSITVQSGGTVSNLQVAGAGEVSLLAGANVVGDIVLSGSGARLQFVGATLPTATIDGLAVGDTIDLANITGGTSASYAGGKLVVSGAHGVLASIALGGTLSGGFSVGTDSGGGTLITVVNNTETAAAAISNYQAGTLPASQVAVSDSAAAVSANLSGLESIAAAGKLASIALTDSGYATLSVTAAQLTADAAAINAVGGNFILAVDASTATNATIAGLSAHATVVSFSGTASQYTVASDHVGGVTVTGSAIGTDHISNATILQFSDYSEVLASNVASAVNGISNAGIAELYAAGLGRAPDAAGLSYYENLLKATPTLTGATVAGWFLSSPEYAASHSYAQSSAGDAQFVSDLYTNLLHRAGSATEVAFYQTIINQLTSGLTAGTASYAAAELAGHAVVLADFSASAEFLTNIQITAQNTAGAQHWLVLI